MTVALSGEGTSYSHDPKKILPDPPALPVGAAAALVSLVQVRVSHPECWGEGLCVYWGGGAAWDRRGTCHVPT